MSDTTVIGIQVEGLDRVIRDLNAEVKKIPFRTLRGMIKAGLWIQREAQKLTPVDFGNLKASAFTVWSGKKGAPPQPSFKVDPEHPLVAVQLAQNHNNVVASEQANVGGDDFVSPTVEVGFTAFYAIYVHEDLNANHKVGTAKYLEKAISGNLEQIKRDIREEAEKP